MKLEQIIEQVRGVSYKPSDVCDLECGTPILRANNIFDNEVNFEVLVYINPNRVSGDQLLRDGDVFICASSGSKQLVGKAGVFKSYTKPISFGAFCKVIRVKDNKSINKDYIRLFFRSDCYRRQISFLSKGASINNIKTDDINNLQIAVPSLQSQNVAVSRMNSLISALKRKEEELTYLNDLIKSRFIEMFSNEKSISVEEACESFKIGPFGSALHKNEISKEGYAFVLGTDNAVKNHFAFDEIRYINKGKFNQLEKYTVSPGDVIMSMMGTVGRVSVIPESLGTAIISSHLCILKVNKTIMYPEFFHLAFCKDDDIQYQIEGIHNGSIMKGFNLKIVKQFKIKCPTKAKQKEFISFVGQIDKSRSIVQQQIKELQELLDSTMEQYFG